MTTPQPEPDRPSLVVVGYGMVAHRLLRELQARHLTSRWRVTVVGGEPRPAYDRVQLSSWFRHRDAAQLQLGEPGFAAAAGVEVVLGDPVTAIDRTQRRVSTAGGRSLAYDRLVLATGSTPFVPPVPGRDRPGVFVYRTVDDLEAIDAWAARPGVRVGAVLGGGLLGLEAADALRTLGLETHVVEMAPHLMPAQLDEGGADVLRARLEDLGLHLHTGTATEAVLGAGADGPVDRLAFSGGTELDVDVVVVSAGIRPCDQLARQADLDLGERGGVLVDDGLATSDPAILAVGEVAAHRGRCYGLVAPGYRMAEVVAARLDGDDVTFEGGDTDTKLKLLGVDVVSFGDAKGSAAGSRAMVWHDEAGAVHRRITLDGTGRVTGGLLVGDASGHAVLAAMASGDLATPADPAGLVAPAVAGDAVGPAAGGLPDAALVCSCESVTKGAVCAAVDDGCHDPATVRAATGAGSGCGGCTPMVADLVRDRLESQGVAVDRSLCEHFDLTRRELFALIAEHGHRSWADVLAAHGRGRGCAVCRPTVASILASQANGYVLDGDQAAIQDSNDHVLANIQRDGSYSVIPRVPGGEITPDQLVALGQIARDFGLTTKITGGQRIDLLGARLEQLPAIWARVVDAGMESGHAYGKAVRTVKSCVGSTWCRYGVQDSTALAIRLELRYRGLRSPHKIKLAVSGCARECAEAQSKDVGVIATDRGWNLYVGGNGGKTPRHADLFATDLDDEALVRAIDRFLMYYVRTADRLERTATWLQKLEGGLDHLRAVVLDDALGIGADLEAEMARHVGTYQCEWKATLADPARLARFTGFVNEPGRPDPDIVRVPERGMHRPALPGEVAAGVAVAVR